MVSIVYSSSTNSPGTGNKNVSFSYNADNNISYQKGIHFSLLFKTVFTGEGVSFLYKVYKGIREHAANSGGFFYFWGDINLGMLFSLHSIYNSVSFFTSSDMSIPTDKTTRSNSC